VRLKWPRLNLVAVREPPAYLFVPPSLLPLPDIHLCHHSSQLAPVSVSSVQDNLMTATCTLSVRKLPSQFMGDHLANTIFRKSFSRNQTAQEDESGCPSIPAPQDNGRPIPFLLFLVALLLDLPGGKMISDACCLLH
jgi:hypothetical protein